VLRTRQPAITSNQTATRINALLNIVRQHDSAFSARFAA